jgi:integrase
MARKIGRLTALDVKRLTTRGMHHDGGGLYLAVAANGSRSWIFRYGAQGRRHFGLGATHSVTLPEARSKARDARRMLLDGVDPIAARRARKLAARLDAAKQITFAKAAETYIEAHHTAWKADKNRQQWHHTLRDHAYPVIGNLPVASIDTGMVMRVLGPIWTTKTETAARVRMRVEKVLSWAAVHGYRSGDNPARWSGHLDQLLPAQGKVAPVEHHAAMPYVDVPAFLSDLRGHDVRAARALEFLILTATRTSEVIGAEWSEIDVDAGVWTVPAGRMKSGREHRVPLSDRAIEILTALPRDRARVFGIAETAMRQLLARLGRSGATPHGFRSSFRDWAAETHHASRDVAEMALAHAVSDKTEAAYRRGDLFAKRRGLMADWAAFATAAPSADNVVGIGGARRG